MKNNPVSSGGSHVVFSFHKQQQSGNGSRHYPQNSTFPSTLQPLSRHTAWTDLEPTPSAVQSQHHICTSCRGLVLAGTNLVVKLGQVDKFRTGSTLLYSTLINLLFQTDQSQD